MLRWKKWQQGAAVAVIAGSVAGALLSANGTDAQTPGFTVYVDAVADGAVGAVQTTANVASGASATIEVEVQNVPAPGLNGYNVTINWSPAANLTLIAANITNQTGLPNQIVKSAGAGTATVAFTDLGDVLCSANAGVGPANSVLFTAMFTGAGPGPGPVAITINPALSDIALCDAAGATPAAFDPGEIVVVGGSTATPTNTPTNTPTTPTSTPVPPTFTAQPPLAVSFGLCVTLSVSRGASVGEAIFKCLSLHTPAGNQLVDLYLGDHDSKLEREDFARWDLDKNQIHEIDGSLWVVGFVAAGAPVQFTATRGGFVNPNIQNVNLGSVYTCDTGSYFSGGDPDCTSAVEGGEDGVVFALYKPFGAARGAVTVDVSQGITSSLMELTITGEPWSVELLTLESEVEAGTATALNTAPGHPVRPTDCVLPRTQDQVLAAAGRPDRAYIVAIVRDSDGLAITGGWLAWLPRFGGPGSDTVGLALTGSASIDLGAFGVGALNITCGGALAGLGVVTATTTMSVQGLVVDPGANIASADFAFTVKSPPSAIALTVTPAEIACDGTASAEVAATVTNIDGQTVVNGNEVHFAVQASGAANPVIATTTDGVAKTAVTPLAMDGGGVTVVVSAGAAQAAVLVPCRPAATATATITPTATRTNTPVPPTATRTAVVGCPADVNGDGRVSGRDVAAVARGKSRPYSAALDVNNDGKVSLADLRIVIMAMHRGGC